MERAININSLRNLPQYRGKTDDEIWEHLDLVRQKKAEEEKNDLQKLDNALARKLKEFEKDYDISDLKYNDMETLKSMLIALIMLEELDRQAHEITFSGVGVDNLNVLDKINGMSSKLRSDISKLQDDLKISRKIRKSNREESVINYLEDLKVKAQEFAESKMTYIFCPKCNMLLGTVWTLYETEKRNTIRLKCNRKLQDGGICGEEVTVKLSELADTKSNKVELLPETLA